MASELTVQTLRGPTSGANANTVLVPSGQTLHAPGHVIQMQTGTQSGTSSSIGNSQLSYINTGLQVSITPKFASSKILVMASQIIGIGNTQDDVPSGSMGQARMDYKLVEAGGSILYEGRYVGTDDQYEGNLSVVTSTHGVYQASSTSTVTFSTQVREAGGSDSQASNLYLAWYAGSKATITAMEIAQ